MRYFPDNEQLRAFMAAGPVTPELDREAMMRAIPPVGPYRVGTGDVLEIRGPHALFQRAAEPAGSPANDLLLARVDADGNIQVPLAGALQVRGRTLLELEAALAAAVHPQFLVAKPAIVARVTEYRRLRSPWWAPSRIRGSTNCARIS